jgi:hypothetical protein
MNLYMIIASIAIIIVAFIITLMFIIFNPKKSFVYAQKEDKKELLNICSLIDITPFTNDKKKDICQIYLMDKFAMNTISSLKILPANIFAVFLYKIPPRSQMKDCVTLDKSLNKIFMAKRAAVFGSDSVKIVADGCIKEFADNENDLFIVENSIEDINFKNETDHDAHVLCIHALIEKSNIVEWKDNDLIAEKRNCLKKMIQVLKE